MAQATSMEVKTTGTPTTTTIKASSNHTVEHALRERALIRGVEKPAASCMVVRATAESQHEKTTRAPAIDILSQRGTH